MGINLTRLALAAGVAILFTGSNALAQTVVRFQHNETDPPSMAFYNKTIAEFEAQNPDVKIEMETLATEGRLQKLISSINAKTMPEIFKILPAEREQFAASGYLADLDDVVTAIGADDFAEGSLQRIDGKIYDIPYTIGNYSILWYRKDVLDKAGIAPPKNWDELRAAAKALKTDDMNGFIFAAGQNPMTSLFLSSLMWSAGGTYFDKDLKVTFDNPGTVAALELLRDLTPLSPSGIASYSYSEMQNVYMTGTVAMDIFAPRLIARLARETPDLAALTDVAPMPVGPSGIAVKVLSPNVFAIASPSVGAQNTEAAKKFLTFLLTGERMRDFSLTVYPHLIPPLKSAQQAVIEAGANDILGERAASLGRVSFDLSNSLTFYNEAGARIENGRVVQAGVNNPYISPIVARNIPAQVVQRVVVEGEDPKDAAKWGAEQMQAVVDDLKSKGL